MENLEKLKTNKKPLILVVDDESTNRYLLEYVLTSENYRVSLASDGLEGLEKAKDELPDLILLDIRMPKMDGYEVCQRLQKDNQTKEIPIIFITSVSSSDDIIKGLNAGAVDYVKKPFIPKELLARVEIHLELKYLLENQKQLINKLKQQIEENKQLRSLVPICFHCKKVRDDKGFWENVDSYISHHSNIDFSHGICPECMEKYYSDLSSDKQGEIDEKENKNP
jgi:CheY-like chemotaxis protein